jgi:hypothetical protein
MQQGAGQAYEQQQQAEEQGLLEEGILPQEAGVIGMDGGWVPSREQPGGMEGKVGVVARSKEVRAARVLPDPSSLSWVQLSRAHPAGPSARRGCGPRSLEHKALCGNLRFQ